MKSLDSDSRVKLMYQTSNQPCRFFHDQNSRSIRRLAQKLWPKTSNFGQSNLFGHNFKASRLIDPKFWVWKILHGSWLVCTVWSSSQRPGTLFGNYNFVGRVKNFQSSWYPLQKSLEKLDVNAILNMAWKGCNSHLFSPTTFKQKRDLDKWQKTRDAHKYRGGGGAFC